MRHIGLVVLALVACTPKKTKEEKCHDVVEHWRTVSAMPMREGDVMMFMGACTMWGQPTLDCLMAAKNDVEIKKCRDMEK